MSGVGATLREHYADPAKVDALIALGDISSIGEEVGEQHDFNARGHKMTTAYGRDRGETGGESKTAASVGAYAAVNMGAEYRYLFRRGEWCSVTNDGCSVSPLTEAMCRE